MFGITDLPTYIIGTTLIILLPGPNSLYVMSVASRYGIRAGYRGAWGVYTGDLILIILTALGAASVLHALPWLFLVLKIIGASYLSYLGYKLLCSAWQTWQRSTKTVAIQQREQLTPFRTALGISILNPKAILFYLSFFVQFVDQTYAYPALSFAVLAIILQIISFLYLSILIFSGAHLAQYFQQHHRLSTLCLAGVGLLFSGFGIKLALSTL